MVNKNFNENAKDSFKDNLKEKATDLGQKATDLKDKAAEKLGTGKMDREHYSEVDQSDTENSTNTTGESIAHRNANNREDDSTDLEGSSDISRDAED